MKTPAVGTPDPAAAPNPRALEPRPASRVGPPEVHEAFRDTRCAECGAAIEEGDCFLIEKGTHVCLDCAGLGRLVFLPRGNTALTRRAVKSSSLSAVVMKFSRSRKRNERQGVLVEPAALEKAEGECLEDHAARALGRARAALRRKVLDDAYVQRFAARLMELYPGCPQQECREIAEHACAKYSGRVGRSAAAKKLAPGAVTLAVRAHIRHVHTCYDAFFAKGWDRQSAREAVADRIDEVIARWSPG